MDRVLSDLMEKAPAQFLLLAEAGGQILSMYGGKAGSSLAALGSLVAGDLAASREISRLTGQYQSDQLILREGPQTNNFTIEAGPHMVLFVRVGREIPLGWARLLIQETSRQLGEIFSAPLEDLDSLDLGLNDEQLSSLISGGLESIWKE
jgi:hypothetical protein